MASCVHHHRGCAGQREVRTSAPSIIPARHVDSRFLNAHAANASPRDRGRGSVRDELDGNRVWMDRTCRAASERATITTVNRVSPTRGLLGRVRRDVYSVTDRRRPPGSSARLSSRREDQRVCGRAGRARRDEGRLRDHKHCQPMPTRTAATSA